MNEITLDIQGKQSIDLSVAGESGISLGIERSTGTSNYNALGTYVDTSLYWAKADLVAMTTAEIDALLA